jgi:beta-xylosidase
MLSSVLLTLMTSFTNPVWNQNFPDPFVVQDGETFYAYATHNGPLGFQFMSSADLVTWTPLAPVGKPSWSSDQLWAPEVYKWNGKWHLFYSALNPKSGKRDLAVSVGASPKGPFEDVSILIPGRSENPGDSQDGAIDPCIFVEGGKPYLLYIREASPRALKIVELSDDLSRTVGEARTLLFADRPIEQGILDAPTLVKRDGVYWLFYSTGWFQSWKRDASYQVWAASSKSLLGPYTKPEKPVLAGRSGETYSPGHQAVIQLASGEWWMAYHAWNAEKDPMYGHNPAGRTLRLDRLLWTPEGPRVEGPTVSSQPRPKIR